MGTCSSTAPPPTLTCAKCHSTQRLPTDATTYGERVLPSRCVTLECTQRPAVWCVRVSPHDSKRRSQQLHIPLTILYPWEVSLASLITKQNFPISPSPQWHPLYKAPTIWAAFQNGEYQGMVSRDWLVLVQRPGNFCGIKTLMPLGSDFTTPLPVSLTRKWEPSTIEVLLPPHIVVLYVGRPADSFYKPGTLLIYILPNVVAALQKATSDIWIAATQDSTQWAHPMDYYATAVELQTQNNLNFQNEKKKGVVP